MCSFLGFTYILYIFYSFLCNVIIRSDICEIQIRNNSSTYFTDTNDADRKCVVAFAYKETKLEGHVSMQMKGLTLVAED